MRKLILTVSIIFLIFHFGEAQKYKVKRKTGAVLKDKEEVARVEGEVSYLKDTHMKMFQNDQMVLSIKDNYWKSPYREIEGFTYYELEFPELGEKINLKTNFNYINEKQIIRDVMAANGLHIYKDGFKQNEIDQLKASDVVQSIHKDTTEWNELLASWREHAENHDIQVEIGGKDQIMFKKIEPNSGKYRLLPKNATHIIYLKPDKSNDDKYPIIGAISYQNTTREQNFGKAIHEIQIFKRVNSPFDYLGTKSSYLPLAYCDLTSRDDKKYVSYLNGEMNRYLRFSDNLDETEWKKRVQIILDDLVEKGML
ncbi:hypothetical protein [Marivirga sp.]|uniref:hypothetical protein n=1 Tax=Marivirga sp. TaxID=2018662 RepID=UPI0025F41770|nr:hypothetical protein [Marivirga sp.]